MQYFCSLTWFELAYSPRCPVSSSIFFHNIYFYVLKNYNGSTKDSKYLRVFEAAKLSYENWICFII